MTHFIVGIITEEGPNYDYDDCLSDLLAPYDENMEVEPYIYETKAEIIENEKKIKTKIIEAREKGESLYADLSMEEPYLTAETDEDFYNLGYDEDRDYDEDGNELSTYNPNSKWDWWTVGGRWSGYFNGEDSITIGEYKKIIDDNTIPWAVIGPDGVWQEKGKMWWWAFNDATEESTECFKVIFRNLIDSTPDDWYITAVDCHI